MTYRIFLLHYWSLSSLNCNNYTKKNDNGDRKQITSPAGHSVLSTKNTTGAVEYVSVGSDMTHCGS